MTIRQRRFARARRLLLEVAVAAAILGGSVNAQSVVAIHSFDGSDGSQPIGALIQAADGMLYGTTRAGGASGLGTIFRVTPRGNVTLLHSFTADENAGGYYGPSGLVQATDGNFYGTTSGLDLFTSLGFGKVYRMTPAGDVTVLHAFAGVPDGSHPSGLIQAADGNLYGTTFKGGDNRCSDGCGTVFRMTLGGGVTIVHAFTDDERGQNPFAPLIQARDGNFYGTTARTIFRMNVAGEVTPLHTFVSDDGGPTRLLEANDANFYGGLAVGGVGDAGSLFALWPDSTYHVLYQFFGMLEGGSPTALVQGPDGSLYGATTASGLIGQRTTFLFKWTPQGGLTKLHHFGFSNDVNGSTPAGELVHAADGYFYGTTSAGGSANLGVVYRLDTHAPFTDDPLSAGISAIRAVHVSELRARVDALRTRAGLPSFAWSDPVLTAGVSPVRAQHVLDLRAALADVYLEAGRMPPTFSDPDLAAGGSIRVVHVAEIRVAVIAIE